MLISHNREKLLNAIIYFSKHTNNCGKTKLFKLLYLLDFGHFKETGRSVTGMEYVAWKMGPVPLALEQELLAPEKDFLEAIRPYMGRAIDYPMLKLEAKRPFNGERFTKREMRLLEQLATDHKTATAQDLVKLTHAKGSPWCVVYGKGEGDNEKIPYEIAATGPHSAELIERAREYQHIEQHFNA